MIMKPISALHLPATYIKQPEDFIHTTFVEMGVVSRATDITDDMRRDACALQTYGQIMFLLKDKLSLEQVAPFYAGTFSEDAPVAQQALREVIARRMNVSTIPGEDRTAMKLATEGLDRLVRKYLDYAVFAQNLHDLDRLAHRFCNSLPGNGRTHKAFTPG